jgi:Arc/MetJ family transcription regulator
MRTNVVIDDKLMDRAVMVSGLKTKKRTIEEALRLMVHIKGQGEIRKYKGKLKWKGDLEGMRRD